MSPPPPSNSATVVDGNRHHEVDPKIWRACAGASVQIPTLYSRVYYFPQGHIEHCCLSSSSLLPSLNVSNSSVPCIVTSIELLADPITDEVFAHLKLQPAITKEQFLNPPRFGARYKVDHVDDDDDNKVVTFAKILTPSDANNGGGFSVPRYCADSVFPPLDFQADPPVQKLFITDIHGVTWDFRHIYRGTPRRHLLTTGWSKFVNGKRLIAGDSVVFMRKSVDKMFIGVRRAPISSSGGGTTSYYGGGDDFSCYYPGNGDGGGVKEDGGVKKVFRRVGKGKLTADAVSTAIQRASKGMAFEVVYYPTAGWSDFVVRAEDVERAWNVVWSPGTRVKMAMETEDSSRITWFQGIVSSTSFQENAPLGGSIWKTLQITWDEPDILQNVKRVNPWQVEVVANSSQLQAVFNPAKRLKYYSSGGGFLSGEEGDFLYSQRALSGAIAPESNPYMYQSTTTTFPASMQGARQYEFGTYNSTGFIGENSPQLPTTNFFVPLPGLGNVSTEMNFGSPRPEDLSPTSNTTNQSGPNSARVNSFQLFGKTITVQEPSESGHTESGLYEEDGSKEGSDNEVPDEKQKQLSVTRALF